MDWASITHQGTREINEDCTGFAQTSEAQCFIVADGLGGHGKGDIASGAAVEAFCSTFQESDLPMNERIESMFIQAQKAILRKQAQMHCPLQMKTTATVLTLTKNRVQWAHIGDSRLYGFGHLWGKVRTLDHSVPQMLVYAREIKENEIRHHPDRNRLLRVLGVSGDKLRFEMSASHHRCRYRAFLLCTDGFWELIEDEEMRACLNRSKSAQEWLGKMEEIVVQRGKGRSMDNYSAVAVLL